MARVIRKVLLAPRGQVRREFIPYGAMVARIGVWEGSPYVWLWVDPNEVREQQVDFLIVCAGDEVADDAFYPIHSFAWSGGEDGMWFGLVKWGVAL